jgi:hypothetical protein
VNITLPTIEAVMARRLLINFRVRPDVAASLLPAPFRPKLVHDWAMSGICLIRLEQVRPRGFPAPLGIASENAAHRIAVEWDEAGTRRTGVFIPRRDSDSHFNAMAGGRLFPGVHSHARFWCAESDRRVKVEMRADDGGAFVRVAARLADAWPGNSLFASLEEASGFFRSGACGWSPCRCGCEVEGLELRTDRWEMTPLDVERVESSFFADARRFPAGSVEFDCALLMRGIPHTWHALGRMPIAQMQKRNRHGATAFLELP